MMGIIAPPRRYIITPPLTVRSSGGGGDHHPERLQVVDAGFLVGVEAEDRDQVHGVSSLHSKRRECLAPCRAPIYLFRKGNQLSIVVNMRIPVYLTAGSDFI